MAPNLAKATHQRAHAMIESNQFTDKQIAGAVGCNTRSIVSYAKRCRTGSDAMATHFTQKGIYALKPARARGRFEIELAAASRAAVKFMKRASIELQTRKKSSGHSE